MQKRVVIFSFFVYETYLRPRGANMAEFLLRASYAAHAVSGSLTIVRTTSTLPGRA